MPRASDGRCIWCERELPPARRVLLVELLEALDDMDRDNDELLEWLLSDYCPRIRAFLERRPEPTRERDTGDSVEALLDQAGLAGKGAGAGFQGPMLSGETLGRLADDPDHYARLLERFRQEPGAPDRDPGTGQVYGDEL